MPHVSCVLAKVDPFRFGPPPHPAVGSVPPPGHAPANGLEQKACGRDGPSDITTHGSVEDSAMMTDRDDVQEKAKQLELGQWYSERDFYDAGDNFPFMSEVEMLIDSAQPAFLSSDLDLISNI